jgi:hypothetical protein
MESNRKRGQGLSWTVAPVEEEEEEDTSTLPYGFMVWCFISVSDNCASMLILQEKS